MTLTSSTPTETTTRHTPRHADASAPAFTSAVRTTGLTKVYGDRTVVDNLDIDLPAGVVTGFVGPNGAGKTTTIRMLLGLVRPSSGTGEVLGRSLAHPARYLGSVGALIDGPAFTANLSGSDNLRVLARTGGLPLRRVPEALERVGLAERGEDKFRAYSLGMKQRLGIAAALLPNPALLVLDEPTNGLDPAGIAQMRDLISSFSAEGMTVFVSSHLLAEVQHIAEHLLMIRNGRMVFQGSVDTLVRSHPPRIVLASSLASDADLIVDIAAALDWPAVVAQTGEVVVELPLTTTDQEAVARATELNRRAHDVDVTLSRLEVRRPTLEEAFFELTGTDSGDVR